MIKVMRLYYMCEKQSSEKPVVLVVEDEALLRFDAVDILQECGFAVEEAASAEVAIEILEKLPNICLIFTDIQMPGAFDGMELARRVHERWPNIHMVVTSGLLRPDRSEIPEDGRFLSKPYRAKDLVAHVNDLLQLA